MSEDNQEKEKLMQKLISDESIRIIRLNKKCIVRRAAKKLQELEKKTK